MRSLSAVQDRLCIAPLLELGSESLIESGRLEVIFPDWLDERFSLYALHTSRHHLPPKTRAFLDFVTATVKSPNLDHGKGRQGIEPAR